MISMESSIAMYEQIATVLREEILKRKYGEKGSIGTHPELAKRFGVSLITIRKAIQTLVADNMVVVRQGKGTFVKGTALQDGLTSLTGVTNIMSQMNLEAEVLVNEMKYIRTPAYFSPSVRESMGAKCLYIERSHLIDDVVIGFAKLYLPFAHGEKITREDVEKYTIYQLYENKLGVTLGRGIQHISANKAGAELARVLNVSDNTPVLRIDRESYSAEGELIEVMELFYGYTEYSFRVELDLRSH